MLQLAKHVNIVNLLEAYKSQSGRLYLVFGEGGPRVAQLERGAVAEVAAGRAQWQPGVYCWMADVLPMRVVCPCAEYVERTLLQELKANRGGMPPAAVKSLTWQLLQSLSYLHRKQIIHRDVGAVHGEHGRYGKEWQFGFYVWDEPFAHCSRRPLTGRPMIRLRRSSRQIS